MELVDLLKKNKVVLYSEMVDMQHHVKKKKKKGECDSQNSL